ncbi:MAG: hypothetical protein WBO93_17255, partial [Gammaproteobacteria bacterium]
MKTIFPLLDGPVKSVRIEAARVLAQTVSSLALVICAATTPCGWRTRSDRISIQQIRKRPAHS